MNEHEKTINLMNEGFLENEIPKSFFDKIQKKKWSIMRKAFCFSLGVLLSNLFLGSV